MGIRTYVCIIIGHKELSYSPCYLGCNMTVCMHVYVEVHAYIRLFMYGHVYACVQNLYVTVCMRVYVEVRVRRLW